MSLSPKKACVSVTISRIMDHITTWCSPGRGCSTVKFSGFLGFFREALPKTMSMGKHVYIVYGLAMILCISNCVLWAATMGGFNGGRGDFHFFLKK